MLRKISQKITKYSTKSTQFRQFSTLDVNLLKSEALNSKSTLHSQIENWEMDQK